ncbi:urokinase plasminogen activator surface receptor-like isoform X2 [Mustelus asterias]
MKLFSGIFIIGALVTGVEESTIPNGLECYACQSDSVAACANSMSIVKCVGNQNRCSYPYTQLPTIGVRAVIKGCLSESTCQLPKLSIFGVQHASDIHCCQGNRCNKGTTLPGRQCHTCIGPPGNCSSFPIQCISSSCITAYFKQVISGTSQELLIKGCGNCFGTLSFNAGEFSVERVDNCCTSDNCNTGTITGQPNAFNGLQCYGCTRYSTGNCFDPNTLVKCVGKQTRCLHSSTIENSRDGFIKGCASESICNNPSVLSFYNIQSKQDFYCCTGNGCNRWSINPGSSAT